MKTTAPLHRFAPASLLLIAGLQVGCSGLQVNDRDALWTQNEQLQSEVERLRALLDRRDNELAALRSRNDQLLANQNAGPTPTRDPFAGVQDGGITSTITDAAVTIRIPGDVLFDSGKVELKPEMQASLNEIAAIIQREYPTQTVRVEGYTDTDPITRSGWDDNLELSLQRAAAVTRQLASRGVSAGRMYASGFGEHAPLGSKEASRRVEIVVLLKD